MKLNKKLAGIIAGALCLITIGGIAAYLTSTKTLRNTITVGHNEIDIIETFEPPAALIPGTTFRKEVSVKNTGPVACYVRVMVTPNDIMAIINDGVRLSSKYAQEDGSGRLPDYNNRDWELVESENGITSWYYYKEPLQPGEETTSLFDHVTLLEEARSVDTGASGVVSDPNEVPSWMEDFDITIYAESYQAENEDGPFENYEAAWAHYQMNRPVWNLNENSVIEAEYTGGSIFTGQIMTPDMFTVTATDEEGHVTQLQPYADYIVVIDPSDYIEGTESQYIDAITITKETIAHILVGNPSSDAPLAEKEVTVHAIGLNDEGVQLKPEFITQEQPLVLGDEITSDMFRVTAIAPDGTTHELEQEICIPVIPTDDPECDLELDENHHYNKAVISGANTEVTLLCAYDLLALELGQYDDAFASVTINVPGLAPVAECVQVTYIGPNLKIGDTVLPEYFDVIMTDNNGFTMPVPNDMYAVLMPATNPDDPENIIINEKPYTQPIATSTSNTFTVILPFAEDNIICKDIEVPATAGTTTFSANKSAEKQQIPEKPFDFKAYIPEAPETEPSTNSISELVKSCFK